MADTSIFREWTNAQLKEYIDENGGCSRNFFERSDLVAEAARLAQEVERNVLKGAKAPAGGAAQPSSDGRYPSVQPSGGSDRAPYGAGPGASWPPAAGSSAYPGQPPYGASQPPYGVPPAPYGAPAYGAPPYGAQAAPQYGTQPPPYGAAPQGPAPYPAVPYPPGPGGASWPPAGPPVAPAYPAGPPAAPAYPAYPPTGGAAAAAAPYPPTYGAAGGRTDGAAAASSSSSNGSAYPSVHGGAPAAAAEPSRYPSAPSAPPAAVASAPPAPASVPQPMPPAGGSKKKAMICGCNYFGTASQLNGCINDAKCMEYLLRTKFGFRPENILLMVDNHADPLRRPTRYNMMQGFAWLTTGLKPGDSLFFHFSGHGSQCRDYTGEEADGLNETLCPCDFKKAGEIVDDEINARLVNPIPTGVKLHAVVDACHSGSTFDLPYHAYIKNGRAQWRNSYERGTRVHKGTAGGFCVQFGASKDSQVAADTSALSGSGVSTGAATYAFIQAIEHRSGKITYGELLVSMHQTLVAATGGGGPSSQSMMGLDALLGALLTGSTAGYRGQEPVLSSCYPFDLNYTFDL